MQNNTLARPGVFFETVWDNWPASMRLSKDDCEMLFFHNVPWDTEKGRNDFERAVNNFRFLKKVMFLDYFLDLDYENGLYSYWENFKTENMEGKKNV